MKMQKDEETFLVIQGDEVTSMNDAAKGTITANLIGGLQRDVRTLQKRVRELGQELVVAIKKAEGTYGLAKMDLENQVEQLEQDGKLLDWFEANWCHKIKNKFKEDILVIGGVEARGTDLRQVLAKAMAQERGGDD